MTQFSLCGLLLIAASLVTYGKTSICYDCLRYGVGSCCPDLEPMDLDLREVNIILWTCYCFKASSF